MGVGQALGMRRCCVAGTFPYLDKRRRVTLIQCISGSALLVAILPTTSQYRLVFTCLGAFSVHNFPFYNTSSVFMIPFMTYMAIHENTAMDFRFMFVCIAMVTLALWCVSYCVGRNKRA